MGVGLLQGQEKTYLEVWEVCKATTCLQGYLQDEDPRARLGEKEFCMPKKDQRGGHWIVRTKASTVHGHHAHAHALFLFLFRDHHGRYDHGHVVDPHLGNVNDLSGPSLNAQSGQNEWNALNVPTEQCWISRAGSRARP